MALVMALGLPSVVRAERPLLAAGVGAGFDAEPSRSIGMPARDVRSLVAAFSFEGEILWPRCGLLVRGVGVDGSIDYEATGFDRLGLSFAATFRPLFTLGTGSGYGSLLLRRVTLEGGLHFQHVVAGFTSGNGFGFHLGLHADFPLGLRDQGTGPFLRLTLQRPILLAEDTIMSGISINPIEPGSPMLQVLVAIAVAF